MWAAALTYYGILAIFPAIIALVSILGLIGPSATQPLLDNVSQVAPGPAKDILTSTIQNLQNNRGSAGVMFFVGIALALWSASGYVASFMQAANAIYDIPEGRPIWKTVPVRLGVTVVLVALLAVSAVAVVLTGTLAKQAGDVVGVGSTAVTVWDIAKWPVLLLIIGLMFAILYYFSPNVKQPGLPLDQLRAVSWPSCCGSSPRPSSRSTWPTSAPTTRPTAHSPGRSSSWSGCGSRTSPSSWAPRSTPSSSADGASRPGTRADIEPFVEPRDTRKFSDEEKREVTQS